MIAELAIGDSTLVTVRIPPLMYRRLDRAVELGAFGVTNKSEFITRCINQGLDRFEREDRERQQKNI